MSLNKIIFLLMFFFAFIHCESKKEVPRPAVIKVENRPLIVEDEDGKYTEWYPGFQQKKITGRKNKDGKRVGIWKYYSEAGVELSVSVYNSEGKRDGHIVVRYPNGNIHYIGEYKDDEKIGEWEFYEENGDLSKVENFSY